MVRYVVLIKLLFVLFVSWQFKNNVYVCKTASSDNHKRVLWFRVVLHICSMANYSGVILLFTHPKAFQINLIILLLYTANPNSIRCAWYPTLSHCDVDDTNNTTIHTHRTLQHNNHIIVLPERFTRILWTAARARVRQKICVDDTQRLLLYCVCVCVFALEMRARSSAHTSRRTCVCVSVVLESCARHCFAKGGGDTRGRKRN